MQKEINIAAILKDKPEDTKLWSPIFGEVLFTCVNNTNKDSKISIIVRHRGYTEEGFFCDGRFDESGERLLFPSKSMLDWSKFAWKKGDVLISKDTDSLCIFDSFEDDTYSTFNVKYYNNPLYLSFDLGVISRATEPFTKVDDDEAKNFIRKIEEHYGGKLNLQTLEIEKPQFKPFDKVLVRDKENDEWRISLFSHYTNGIYPYFCLNATYKYCIPYNDQTAHLLGTTDDWEGGEA